MAILHQAADRGRAGGSRARRPPPEAAFTAPPSAKAPSPKAPWSKPPWARAPRTVEFSREMRALRGQLQPLLDQRRPAVLGVTGCNPQEGVTTVTRELARSLAADGVAVLLCGDAARTFHKVKPDAVARAAGARRILQTASAALHFVDLSDLHRADNPTAAMLAFRAWLQTKKGAYAVVLIDMPPVLNQPGWSPLFSVQDGVLLVMQAERTRSVVLKTAIGAIEGAGGHILGIVFNKRRRHIPGLFYRWL